MAQVHFAYRAPFSRAAGSKAERAVNPQKRDAMTLHLQRFCKVELATPSFSLMGPRLVRAAQARYFYSRQIFDKFRHAPCGRYDPGCGAWLGVFYRNFDVS
jgi:hypothetical protein